MHIIRLKNSLQFESGGSSVDRTSICGNCRGVGVQRGKPNGLVIVAHPDDEVLWCGGFLLMHPEYKWHVVVMCRKSDPDREPRFHRSLERLGATGVIGDLDDAQDQEPLPDDLLDRSIRELLEYPQTVDLLLTHGVEGEYTRHRRHEECHRSVMRLRKSRFVTANELRCFAYHDSFGTECPGPRSDAGRRIVLSPDIRKEKRSLLTKTYGFAPTSWEARCAPMVEAFTAVD